MPEQGTPSTTTTEQWSQAQLYLLIQRVSLKAEQIHTELQRRCIEKRNQITTLTKQRNQLLREKTNLQEQANIVIQALSSVWPAARAHYAPLPAGIEEDSIALQAHHLREVFTSVCRENQELQVALAARPTLPDPPSDHSEQVTAKQTQAVNMQATLHSTAVAASALLRSL